MKLLVLSDMHVGDATTGRCVYNADNCSALAEYIDGTIAFLRDQAFQPELIVIPGDLSHQGQPDELIMAASCVNRLAAGLGVPQDRIVFVPGNHDHDWRPAKSCPEDKPDRSGLRSQQRFAPLAYGDCGLHAFMNGAHVALLEDPFSTCMVVGDAVFALVNTAAFDHDDSEVHAGSITNAAISNLENQLQSLSPPVNALKILLIHHHPLQYPNPFPTEFDVSALNNAEELLTFASRARFHLVIHGHRHIPTASFQARDLGLPMLFLGAGSYSGSIHARLRGEVLNCMHALEDNGTHPVTGLRDLTVRTFAYWESDGWRSNDAGRHFPSTIAFGSYRSPMEMAREMATYITTRLTSLDLVPLTALLAFEPSFSFVPESFLKAVLHELSSLPGIGVSPDNWHNSYPLSRPDIRIYISDPAAVGAPA